MGNNHQILSIDGGGTKTDLLLYDVEQYHGVLTTGEGINPNIYGEQGITTLVQLSVNLVKRVDLNIKNISECIIGMAGISNPKYREKIENRLSSTFPKTRLSFTSDAELAHRSIWGKKPGMTLIVGTGSIALGENKHGRLRRSGGLGYQVGDEGSGFWLGKVLLTELIVAERSVVEDVKELINLVLEHSHQTTFEDALNFLSFKKNHVSLVAGLVPDILSFAAKGNLIAHNIVQRGAEALGNLIEELINKLEIQNRQVTIGVSGSVITKSDYYRKMIEDQLLFLFDTVEWFFSDFPPVYGALVLSKQNISPEDFSRMKIEYV